MKTLVTTISIGLLLIGLGLSLKPKKAQCAWCNTFPCFNSGMCGLGCSCMKSAGDISGQCVSFNLQEWK